MIQMPRRLLPMSLATLDEFFLADDRRNYPMTFASNSYFRGEFDREAFTAAVHEALGLHPLLHALVQRGRRGQLCWVAAKDLAPVIDWGTIEQPVELPQRQALDLRCETGLRIWIRQSQGRAHVVFQFHHACCDATGAHRFIGDVLAAYGIRTTPAGQTPPRVAQYDPFTLRGRNRKLADLYYRGALWPLVRRAIGQLRGVVLTKVAVMRSRRGGHSTRDAAGAEQDALPSYPDAPLAWLDAQEHKQLRTVATGHGAMLNDLLLAEMFLALHQWNRLHGGPAREHLRIMMPTDLRQQADFVMPAANMSSYSFLSRTIGLEADFCKLLWSIRDETLRIRSEQRGRWFMDAVMTAKMVPGLLSLILWCGHGMCTVTMSHLGDPPRRFTATFPRTAGFVRCGDVELESMRGVAPLRPGMRAAITIITMNRQLAINMRVDPRYMDHTDAVMFLNLYMDRLRAHLTAPASSA